MTKEEILKQFKVKSLEEVSDSDIIKLALEEKFGRETAISAQMGWCFKTKKELADHIRKAISHGKELFVQFEWDEGFSGGDRVIVKYVDPCNIEIVTVTPEHKGMKCESYFGFLWRFVLIFCGVLLLIFVVFVFWRTRG